MLMLNLMLMWKGMILMLMFYDAQDGNDADSEAESNVDAEGGGSP